MASISLKDREPVLQAIRECDRLGRNEFLRRHGYKRATEYLLIHEAKEYDSKAILGVAHHYAHGRALHPGEFSGGTAAAVRVLTDLGFEIRRVERKLRLPLWTDEERILALDVYLQNRPRNRYSSQDVEVQQLSDLLRRRQGFPTEVRADPRFRPPSDIRDKLNSFANLDNPSQPTRKANYEDVRLWNTWRADAAGLHALAKGIRELESMADQQDLDLRSVTQPSTTREAGSTTDVFTSPEEGDAEPLIEGGIVRVQMNQHERNPRARAVCIAHYGASCQVCGLDFAQRYGKIGRGFIHVHHLRELSTRDGAYTVDPIQDLRPVCPNCHAMLHTKKPAMSIEQLRGLLVTS